MTPVFLMSPPRLDWCVRGRANPFSQAAAGAREPSGADALRDWLRVANLIEVHGGHVVVMPSDDPTLTGLPYTAEAGIMGRDGEGPVFIVARLTPAHRVAEADIVERTMQSFGVRTARARARFEGQGDVLFVDDERTLFTTGEGRFARTEPAALPELMGLWPTRVHPVRFRADPWFHGNTFLGCYRSARGVLVLVCEEALLPDERAPLRAFVGDARWEPISHDESLAYATNALQIGDHVLVPAQIPARVRRLFIDHGLTPVDVELPALFSAGGGAAVCLTNRLDGMRAQDFPSWALFSAHRDALHAALPLPEPGAIA